MKSGNIIILVSMAVVISLAVIVPLNAFIMDEFSRQTSTQALKLLESEQAPNLQLTSKDFTSKIDRKYLAFTPGTKYIYEGKTEEGTERTEVYVTGETKKVMGVDALVVWDRVWLNNELIEDTKDWFAQDKYGDVWYFGEDSKDIVNGKIAGREGSWGAGVDGAQPGIVMKANPKVGDKYRQEYYKGEAEDMAEVVATGVKIKVKYGSFSNCLQTRDWSPLEPGKDEYKYYCPEISNLVYEVGIEDGEGAQLIKIEKSKI